MMSKKMKRILAISCLSSFAITSVPVIALAEDSIIPQTTLQEEEIAPYLTYIVDSMCDLEINQNTATVDCWVKGHYLDATKAKVIAELQVKSNSGWLPVGLWTDTQNDYMAWVTETKSVTKGQVYRVKSTVTVWEGSQSETLTIYTDEVTA